MRAAQSFANRAPERRRRWRSHSSCLLRLHENLNISARTRHKGSAVPRLWSSCRWENGKNQRRTRIRAIQRCERWTCSRPCALKTNWKCDWFVRRDILQQGL